MNPVKESFNAQVRLALITSKGSFYSEKDIIDWLSTFDGYELVKKEPEIAKCACGHEPVMNCDPSPRYHNGPLYFVSCGICAWRGPKRENRELSIKCWNEVMGK